MEDFLTDYVNMYADARDIEIDDELMTTIVDGLMNEDEIWDILDSYISDYLEEKEEE